MYLCYLTQEWGSWGVYRTPIWHWLRGGDRVGARACLKPSAKKNKGWPQEVRPAVTEVGKVDGVGDNESCQL